MLLFYFYENLTLLLGNLIFRHDPAACRFYQGYTIATFVFWDLFFQDNILFILEFL